MLTFEMFLIFRGSQLRNKVVSRVLYTFYTTHGNNLIDTDRTLLGVFVCLYLSNINNGILLSLISIPVISIHITHNLKIVKLYGWETSFIIM